MRLLALAACFWIFGCSPPGPRALIEGKRFLDEGEFPKAVTSLERAATLLPRNALAWNYLGLAYHAVNEPEKASRAYRVALSLDRNLAAVRYNLGCLYFEQDNLTNALEELRSFTLLQPGAVDGWLKQGAALTRVKRLDEAERSFRTALELRARHPEALNGLGLVQMQRRRYQDAMNYFNAAATQEPPYPPAVLNGAIVQQQLNNRSGALKRYRQFLSLNTSGEDVAGVESIVRQMELELNPHPEGAGTHAAAASQPVQSALTAVPASLTNAVKGTGNQVSSRPHQSVVVSTTSPPVVPSRTNPVLVAAVRAASDPAAKSSTFSNSPTEKPAIETARSPIKSPSKGAELLTVKPAQLEIASIPPEPVVRPAQELPKSPAPLPSLIETQPRTRTGTNGVRRGFFARFNPFGGRNRTNAGATEIRPTVVRSSAVPAGSRYAYLAPAAPTPGDSALSEKAFKLGVKAQRAGSLSLAITEYQAAVKADPANFDAYYNLGLASLERGDSRLSLWAYEIALALRPDNSDARYNFALALKAGGYWVDASEQFQMLIDEDSADARAHLSLANLYAQQFQQPDAARAHYQRVLEINPKHPEAAKIRFWLAANP